MKSNYHFEKRKDHLYIILSGEYDMDDFKAYPKVVHDICESEKIYKVLVHALDIKRSNVPTMDRFFIGEEAAKVLGQKIKIAVVWPENDIDKMAETVAVNRGGRMLVTGNVAMAEKWLLS